MEKKEEKMTLEEYQKKYSKPYNEKAVKSFLFIAIAVGALIVIFCLFSLVIQLYNTCDKNVICLYVSIPIAVLVFIFLYVLPVVKIHKLKPFMTNNISSSNVRQAKKYNRELREKIADQIIDMQAKVGNCDWYNEEAVGKLAIARHTHDDEALRKSLLYLYKNDIKKAANVMIGKKAFQVGLFTALSPSDKLDTAIVVAYNMNLMKDIMFLYGFRPNDRELTKAYYRILSSALMAYGLSNFNLAGKLLEKVPFVGAAVDALSQGVANASFTAYIGFQTKRYLMKDFKLQDYLEEVVLDDDEQINSIVADVKDELIKQIKNKKPITK